MSGVAGLGYYFPWLQTVSYIDTQLNDARIQPFQYPSNALIQHSDNWFNLKNETYSARKVPDEVKWQILFAAKAQMNAYGIIELGANFSIQHLAPDHLVFLYRIINSYHNFEKTQYGGQWAIFHKHLEVIEDRFKQIAKASGWQGFEITKALRSHEDLNLFAITTKMDAYLAGLPAKCFPPILKSPIGIPNLAANCWANSLMQLILQVPSLEQAILYHPNFQSPVYQPFRNFIIAYKRDQEFGKAYVDSVSSQSIREAFHRLQPNGFSAEKSHAEDSSFARAVLMNGIPDDSPLKTPVQNITRNGEMTYWNEHTCYSSTLGIKNRGFTEAFRRSFTCDRNLVYMKPPEEFFLQVERSFGGIYSLEEVDIPLLWHMPENLILTKESADYECDSFIYRTGGHDIAYVKRNGVFFMCDDSYVRAVSNQEAETARRKSTTFHFKKVVP